MFYVMRLYGYKNLENCICMVYYFLVFIHIYPWFLIEIREYVEEKRKYHIALNIENIMSCFRIVKKICNR